MGEGGCLGRDGSCRPPTEDRVTWALTLAATAVRLTWVSRDGASVATTLVMVAALVVVGQATSSSSPFSSASSVLVDLSAIVHLAVNTGTNLQNKQERITYYRNLDKKVPSTYFSGELGGVSEEITPANDDTAATCVAFSALLPTSLTDTRLAWWCGDMALGDTLSGPLPTSLVLSLLITFAFAVPLTTSARRFSPQSGCWWCGCCDWVESIIVWCCCLLVGTWAECSAKN